MYLKKNKKYRMSNIQYHISTYNILTSSFVSSVAAIFVVDM